MNYSLTINISGTREKFVAGLSKSEILGHSNMTADYLKSKKMYCTVEISLGNEIVAVMYVAKTTVSFTDKKGNPSTLESILC